MGLESPARPLWEIWSCLLWVKGMNALAGELKRELAEINTVKETVEQLSGELHNVPNIMCCGFAIFVGEHLERELGIVNSMFHIDYFHNGAHGLAIARYSSRAKIIYDSSLAPHPV